MKRLILLASTAAALTLGACSDNTADTAEPVATDTATETAMMDDNAMPVGGELNTQQQTNYDAMDRQAVSDEYDTNRDTMQSGMASGTAGATPTTGASDGAMGASTTASNAMPSRGQMDFSYLDRNGDGKLSVAEYAIWAVPANPNVQNSQNNQTKPYISTDQINTAGETFFYFDQNGDSYLQPEEFTTARNSARTPGGSDMGGSMGTGTGMATGAATGNDTM